MYVTLSSGIHSFTVLGILYSHSLMVLGVSFSQLTDDVDAIHVMLNNVRCDVAIKYKSCLMLLHCSSRDVQLMSSVD